MKHLYSVKKKKMYVDLVNYWLVTWIEGKLGMIKKVSMEKEFQSKSCIVGLE